MFDVQHQTYTGQIYWTGKPWELVGYTGLQPSFLQNCWIRICILQDPQEIHSHIKVGEILAQSWAWFSSVITGPAASASPTKSKTGRSPAICLLQALPVIQMHDEIWEALLWTFWLLCPQKSSISVTTTVGLGLHCFLSRYHLSFSSLQPECFITVLLK